MATIKKTATKVVNTPVKKEVKKTVAKVSKTPVAAKPVVVKPVLSKYLNKNLKISPRKLRLLVTDIKPFGPVEGLARLKFVNTNAGRILKKCIEDAIASAKNNQHFTQETLKFVEFRVDEGLKIKRMDKSHGSRFARGVIQKRHSRLVIVLSGTIAN